MSMRLPDWTLAALAILAAWLANTWQLGPDMFFYADDWSWQASSAFSTWGDFLNLLPHQVYNDRPVGALVLKVIYTIFGPSYLPTAGTSILLHGINCGLIYAIARRYAPQPVALAAGLLAGAWLATLSAVGWSAAMFDVLGATLCLLTVILHQRARHRSHGRWIELAGVLVFVLAIRTKEFALGAVMLLAVIDLLLERDNIRTILQRLAPYLLVFIIYAARYAWLLKAAAVTSTDPYAIKLGIMPLLDTTLYYIRTALYADIDPRLALGLGALNLLGLALCSNRIRLMILAGWLGFCIMLGPVLLLPGQHSPLYLYAGHFWPALAFVAPLAERNWKAIMGLLAAAILLVAPFQSGYRANQINFYAVTGRANQAQLQSALDILGPVAPGSAIFITGVKPYFNPFDNTGGSSLKVHLHDRSVTATVSTDAAQLAHDFCAAPESRRALIFTGNTAEDTTAALAASCPKP